MKTALNSILILALSLSSFTASALEFTTDCVSGSSARNTNDLYGIQRGLTVNSGLYSGVGHQNSYHVTTYLWSKMPAQFFTGAAIVGPVTLGGKLKTANMDYMVYGYDRKGLVAGQQQIQRLAYIR